MNSYRTNPICHYIEKGQNDLRSPNPFFDIAYYLSQLTPSEMGSFKDPFSHYIVKGARSRLNPHPLIDVDYYCTQLSKIDIHPDNVLEYFNEEGLDGIVLSHPFLDAGYCIAQLCSENDSAGIQMRDYYDEDSYGSVQNTHPLFDVEHYRSKLETDESHLTNPLIHYLKEGRERGISTHPDFDLKYYCSCDHGPDLNDDHIPAVHYIYHGSQNEKWPSLETKQLVFKPQLHLVSLVNGPDFNYLSSRVVALMAQLYPRWKATIMVRNPDASDDYRYAKTLAEDDKRIQWIETDDTDSASTLLNRALEKISDEFVVFLDERILLQGHAFLGFIRRLNINQNLALIHTDRLDNDPEAIAVEYPSDMTNGLVTRFFIGPLACFRRSIIEQIGGFAPWHQSSYDAKFLTHYLHQAPTGSVAHIAEPCHFSIPQDPLHFVVRPH